MTEYSQIDDSERERISLKLKQKQAADNERYQREQELQQRIEELQASIEDKDRLISQLQSVLKGAVPEVSK